MIHFTTRIFERKLNQECIPVGCVPSAAAAVSGGCVLPVEGCTSGGCASQGVYFPGGVLARGCTSQGVCFPGGVLPRGCASWGEVLPGKCASGGGVVSQHALRQTPRHPPVDRMTDMWKNITFAISRTVTRSKIFRKVEIGFLKH